MINTIHDAVCFFLASELITVHVSPVSPIAVIVDTR